MRREQRAPRVIVIEGTQHVRSVSNGVKPYCTVDGVPGFETKAQPFDFRCLKGLVKGHVVFTREFSDQHERVVGSVVRGIGTCYTK